MPSCTSVTPSLRHCYWQDIPTRFWRGVGEENFDGIFYRLRGPKADVVVQSCRTILPNQIVCHFRGRWPEFVAKNSLKVGDHVLFTQVGQHVFEVRRTDP